jgi:hypothetical protein
VVKANPACLTPTGCTRPVSELLMGVRSSSAVSGQRAAVGQPCNLARPNIPSGTGGDVWAEFGPTYVQGWVAVCSRN